MATTIRRTAWRAGTDPIPQSHNQQLGQQEHTYIQSTAWTPGAQKPLINSLDSGNGHASDQRLRQPRTYPPSAPIHPVGFNTGPATAIPSQSINHPAPTAPSHNHKTQHKAQAAKQHKQQRSESKHPPHPPHKQTETSQTQHKPATGPERKPLSPRSKSGSEFHLEREHQPF